MYMLMIRMQLKRLKFASKQNKKHILVMNMCGRGDKDLDSIAKYLNIRI